MSERFVLAIDQGTTGNTVLLFDQRGQARGRVYAEFPQIFPKPGWVEHDATRIWRDVANLIEQLLRDTQTAPGQIDSVGITNQRETVVCWDRASGEPVCNALVWQDRRTAAVCDRLRTDGSEPEVQSKTGLLLDPYFSATKIQWLLDQDSQRRRRAERGELLVGTMDSWLAWKLSGGAAHVSDYSNASRTQLFNLHTLSWDEDLLRLFDIPRPMLPEVVSSSGARVAIDPRAAAGISAPLTGIAGDQQAAMFGQACFQPGRVKNTYGTGCFALMNTGERPVASRERLLTTIAWRLGDSAVEYALEGAVFIAGAAVQWLRDGLEIIKDAGETGALAASLDSNDDVYFVPALVGLGAPHWDPYARGTLVGLTRGTTRAHIARAALEAICYQSRDVIDAMSREASLELGELRADGGAVSNTFLMQFQADILGARVRVPEVTETTALGAAYLAGLATGFWESREQIERQWREAAAFEPGMDGAQRDALYQRWLAAVARSRGWASS